MKSLFDDYWNEFSQVEKDEKLYGACPDHRIKVVFPKGSENIIFDQNPFTEYPNFDFLQRGYLGLYATKDIKIIKKRQNIIKAFTKDIEGKREFKNIFNNMHLITKLMRFQREKNADINNIKYANLLFKYQKEVENLTDKLASQEGVLHQLSNHYWSRFPFKVHDTVLKACEQGKFNYVVLEIDPRSLDTWNSKWKNTLTEYVRIQGFMDLPKKNIKKQIKLNSNKYEPINISDEILVHKAANEFVDWLNKIYAPLAALYSEAFYLTQENRCLPEINTEGIFEMVNGEPIMPTVNPVGTSLFYDKKTSKLILNGIHSGGKSYLLKTIATYHLDGLSGFVLPAKSAQIPVIDKIIHSWDIDKVYYMGSLESEFEERARTIRNTTENDLILMDEFLQHASPDASNDLEPVILEEFYKTGAAVIVVTHKGESLDENKWQFYSPCFKEVNGRIKASYEFQKGKPDPVILQKHAEQMLEDSLNKKSDDETKHNKPEKTNQYINEYLDWIDKKEKQLFGENISISHKLVYEARVKK